MGIFRALHYSSCVEPMHGTIMLYGPAPAELLVTKLQREILKRHISQPEVPIPVWSFEQRFRPLLNLTTYSPSKARYGLEQGPA